MLRGVLPGRHDIIRMSLLIGLSDRVYHANVPPDRIIGFELAETYVVNGVGRGTKSVAEEDSWIQVRPECKQEIK